MANQLLAEDRFGHGAHKSKLDVRDRKWKKIAMASQPFDWNVGYDIETLVPPAPTKDQGQSSSCGGQSGSYIMANAAGLNTKKLNELSAKFIYSQVFYPNGGGTTARDVLNLLVKKGDCLEAVLSSYQNGAPPSEAFMEDKSGIGPTQISDAGVTRATGYASVAVNIESAAQALRDNGNVLILIKGQNNGTWLGAVPIAPANETALWAHFLAGGKARILPSGQKAIGVHNSWGLHAGLNGWQWVTEDYFKSGYITEVWTLYDTANAVVTQQNISILMQLIQKLINLINGPSKLPL